MVSIRSGPIRTALLLVTLGAVLAIMMALSPSEGAQAALTDPEPPAQYEDWDHAYDLSESELGTPLHIRKEGGSDRDYVRIPFLSLGDRVTIDVEMDNTTNSSEWWVSDPGRFPIWTYTYIHGQANPLPMKFEFLVTLPGSYWFHTGQGLGMTTLELNITRIPSSDRGDENERPEDAQLIEGTSVVNGSIGPPDDCSDFYWFHLAPSNETKVFLRFVVLAPAGSYGYWELYDSTGVQRMNLSHTQDYLTEDIETVFDERIEKADTYYLRLWCYEGAGDYELSVTIVKYPNDRNDELPDATWISYGDEFNETLHTKYDKWDHYVINVSHGDSIRLWMDVDEDLDIFLLDENGNQKASSDNWFEDSEYIYYKPPGGWGGIYYVSVRMSTSLDASPYREIGYRLQLVTNLPPMVDSDMDKTYGSWSILEDRVDERILLTDLFFDPEGGPLTFRVVPGHNASWLNVTVTGADRLRLEPAENASGFVESVTVEAMDGRGMTIRFTIDVAVIAVNDAPGVGHPTAGPPPEVLEFDEDTTGGPWDLLLWFWDCDNTMSEMTFSFETDLYLNAKMDDLDRLIIETLVPDWNGRTSVTIRVWDPEGLGALILMDIVVRPVNDAPVVGHPTAGPPPEVLEFDEDTTGGPWDLLLWFWDCDNAMSEMTFSFETDLYLNAKMDDLDRLLIETLVPDWNGRTNVTIRVWDPEGLGAFIRMPVIVRPVNDPPRLSGPDIEMLVKGRTYLTIDVGGSFEDVDGDELIFVSEQDDGLSIVITGSELFISDLGAFDGQDLVILVHASDPSGERTGPLSIKLSISDVPSPHSVSSSVVEYTMVRGRNRQFTDFEIIDPDELPREYDVFLVVGDQIGEFGVVFTETDMVWRAGIPPHWTPELGGEDGDEVVTLWVTDSWYNASLSWTVHLLSHNSPPEIIRLDPDSEGPYWEGDELTFTVEATDPDGDELLYFWSFDDRYIIMFEEGGASYTVTDLEPGDGIIYLIVSDGFDETRSNQTYLVKRRPNDPRPFEWTFPLLFIVLTVTVLLVILYLSRYRGRSATPPSR